jgi:DHA1 family tetracycline resistance protein-like MFS transporter
VPSLLRELGPTGNINQYGMLVAVYALMRFLCSPVLGALSDRFDLHLILLVSLIGAARAYAHDPERSNERL